jgi:hypothetical protein
VRRRPDRPGPIRRRLPNRSSRAGRLADASSPGEQRRTQTGGVNVASHETRAAPSARSEEAVVIGQALPRLFARDVREQCRIRSDLGSAEFRRVAATGEVLMPVGDPLYGERER